METYMYASCCLQVLYTIFCYAMLRIVRMSIHCKNSVVLSLKLALFWGVFGAIHCDYSSSLGRAPDALYICTLHKPVLPPLQFNSLPGFPTQPLSLATGDHTINFELPQPPSATPLPSIHLNFANPYSKLNICFDPTIRSPETTREIRPNRDEH
jgi:hypothetical protein